MGNTSVTFETKCWEKDWKYVMQPQRLKHIISTNDYDFYRKVLYINNVNDLPRVVKQAKQLIRQKIITSYVVVEDYAEQALAFFNIDKDSFAGGYYYSIQELVGIYLCKTKYLVHFSSDSYPASTINWISPAIDKFESDPKVRVANLTWNNRFLEAKREAFDEDNNFYIGYGFSDQNYLIRVSDFKQKIYNEKRAVSERYPLYGGELFEKRVDSWLRNNSYRRITFKHGGYLHRNFSRRRPVQVLKLTPRKIINYAKFISGSTKKR